MSIPVSLLFSELENKTFYGGSCRDNLVCDGKLLIDLYLRLQSNPTIVKLIIVKTSP